MQPSDPKGPGPDGDRRLGAATWTELHAAPPRTVLVPVGSCEQHGPHLPLDTDTRIAVAVADAVAARRPGALVAPAVAYGASGEHEGFPGTLSIGTEALTTVLVEIGRSAQPEPTADQHLVFVNGHGGNLWAVHRAVEVLSQEARSVRSWAPVIPGGDAHAGRTETSLLLAIAPAVVREERPVGATGDVEALFDRMRTVGVRGVSPNGVVGDATSASADEGRAILADLVAELARALDAPVDDAG